MYTSSLCNINSYTYYIIASDGSDYKGVSMVFVFTAGTSNDTMQCMDVDISNTRTVEEDEIFTVTLTALSPDVLLGNNVTIVTITDTDDGMLTNTCLHVTIFVKGTEGDDNTALTLGVSAGIAVTLILICIPIIMAIVYVKYRRSRSRRVKNKELLGS